MDQNLLLLDQDALNKMLIKACISGDQYVVDYVLTSSELPLHADIHVMGGKPLLAACSNGHFDLVQYLLTSPRLTIRSDIHSAQDYGFRRACAQGRLDIVQYLLTSPELTDHANIHAMDNEGYYFACEGKFFDIINYLLSFRGDRHIDFQQTRHNLEWALNKEYTILLPAMMASLSVLDYMHFFDALPLVEHYCYSHQCEDIYHVILQHQNEQMSIFNENSLYL